MTQNSLLTLLAVGIAVCDAACFAFGAILQHDAVRRTISTPSGQNASLGLRGMLALLRQRRWLAGLALIALGAGLHVVALVLAPVSVVQPIGVLGVPLAVIVAARRGHEHATRGVVAGIAISVVGTAAFVWLTAGKATSVPLTGETLVLAGILVGLLVGAAIMVAKVNQGWVRALACAFGGAAAFGLVAAGMRALSQLIAGDFSRITQPVVIGTLLGIIAAAAIGGTLVQQAYTVGSPEVVLACVTVTDPFVAVLIGLMLLGEGKHMDPLTGFGMAAAAVVATVGVFVLARHHPDAQKQKDSDTDRDAGISGPRGELGTGQPDAATELNMRGQSIAVPSPDPDDTDPKRTLDENPAWR